MCREVLRNKKKKRNRKEGKANLARKAEVLCLDPKNIPPARL